MGKITILPDALCNQIAAGEVVERPAAVVKELIENSIDAGAKKIAVSLLQGGRKEIRVADDGCGMSPDDALLALERHATSKIRTLDDLQSIHSLGFRGEALPSIAAVSRFELTAREPGAVSGTLIRIEGGILRDVRDAGCPAGVVITVRDIFHNIPVRRKFLRSVETEMAHVSDQVLRLALANPGVHLQLFHQERQIYDFPRASSPRERAAQVLGSDLSAKLKPFESEGASFRLRGFASSPDVQRTNAQSLFIFVNGRPVFDRMVNRAVLNAYDSVIPKGKYPAVILFLEIPPDSVDVNVHPTKREVRFRSPGEVLVATTDAIRGTFRNPQAARSADIPGVLHSTAPIAPAGASIPMSRVAPDQGDLRGDLQPATSPEPRPPARFAPAEASSSAPPDRAPRPQAFHEVQKPFPGAALRDRPMAPSSIPLAPRQTGLFPAPGAPLSAGEASAAPVGSASEPDSRAAPDRGPLFSSFAVIGQAGNSYILLEAPDGLILIDQHAAHERILYDRLESLPPGEASQRLLRSAVVNLLPKEAAKLRRILGALSQAGFEAEPFGGDSFVVHAVPAPLADIPPEILLREVLDSHPDHPGTAGRHEMLEGLARTAACHAAVKAGQKLSREEIRRLLEELDASPVSATCPHGRPLWHKLAFTEIARFFQRT